jgi:hypothetical protein
MIKQIRKYYRNKRILKDYIKSFLQWCKMEEEQLRKEKKREYE